MKACKVHFFVRQSQLHCSRSLTEKDKILQPFFLISCTTTFLPKNLLSLLCPKENFSRQLDVVGDYHGKKILTLLDAMKHWWRCASALLAFITEVERFTNCDFNFAKGALWWGVNRGSGGCADLHVLFTRASPSNRTTIVFFVINWNKNRKKSKFTWNFK